MRKFNSRAPTKHAAMLQLMRQDYACTTMYHCRTGCVD